MFDVSSGIVNQIIAREVDYGAFGFDGYCFSGGLCDQADLAEECGLAVVGPFGDSSLVSPEYPVMGLTGAVISHYTTAVLGIVQHGETADRSQASRDFPGALR